MATENNKKISDSTGISSLSSSIRSTRDTSATVNYLGASGIPNSMGDSELKKLLECPVCLEIALPPIYNCETGHMICNECKVKLTECPLCKSPYTSIRNFALESIVEATKFHCDNFHKGCKVSGNFEELKQHHEDCILRPLKCHLAGLAGCKGDLLYLSDYLNHLRDVHKLPFGPSREKPNVFTVKYSLNKCTDYSQTNSTFSGCLFKYDGRVFLNLMRNSGLMFHFGFFLIGDKSQASKYNVKISIQKSANYGVPKYEVTTPFPSIREFQKQIQITNNSLPHAAVMHKDFLESVGYITPAQKTSKSTFSWDVHFEVIKL